MVKLGLVIISMALLVACSSKEEQALIQMHVQKQNSYKNLLKTEKVQFKESNITKMVVTATYMNKPTTDTDDKSDEVFLVGIYSENYEIGSLISEEFNLTLRDVKTKKERKIEEDKKKEERKERRLMIRSLGDDINSTILKKKKKKAVYLSPIDVKRVDKESVLLEGISFVSEWNQFYLVSYKHIAGNRLSLQIKSKKSEEQIKIDIEKVIAKAKAKLLKKKKRIQKKVIKKKKKIKVPLYHTTILNFAKVAKYAL